MGEVSTGRTLVTLIGTILIAILLGLGVYGVVGRFGGGLVDPINTSVLAGTAVGSWISLVVGGRLYYLKQEYYDVRFKFVEEKGGYLRVKYLKNGKMSIVQLLVFMFKPMRYIQTDEFVIDNNEERTLKGILTVEGNRLYVDNFYLEKNTDLYEFIGEDVGITIVGNRKEIIERNVSDYIVKGIKLKTA